MFVKALACLWAAASAASAAQVAQPIDGAAEPFNFPASYIVDRPHRCGPVAKYFNATPADWIRADTDKFLASWIGNHQDAIASEPYGFAQAYGKWVAGNPSFACQDDGGKGCTTDNVCGNPLMNSHGVQTEAAFHVYRAIEGLHAYFMGLSQSFETAALIGALANHDWVRTFYKKKNGMDADLSTDHTNHAVYANIWALVPGMITIITALAGLPGIIAAGTAAAGAAAVAAGAGTAAAAAGASAGLFGAFTPAVSTVLNTLLGGAITTTMLKLPTLYQADSNYVQASDVGARLASLVRQSLQSLMVNNNALMRGQTVAGDGIQDYLKGGSFMGYSLDKDRVVGTMGAMIQGNSINQLWRKQRIFIVGGGECGDGQGLGSGPQNAVWCDSDNKAWYLYWWRHRKSILVRHAGGWVEAPPGMDQLGKGLFPSISVQDVIKSSVQSYKEAETMRSMNEVEKATKRTLDALGPNGTDIDGLGASMPTIFTLPVCDIRAAIGSKIRMKESILKPYGNKPVWCGPICGNDVQTTNRFYRDISGASTFKKTLKKAKKSCPSGTYFGWAREPSD